MIKKIFSIIWPVMVFSNLTGQTVLIHGIQNIKSWYSDAFTLKEYTKPQLKKSIVVAIVDDGFRLTHNAVKNFLYKNPKESNVNYTDDDGNGFIDDYIGWDVSDNDNDVSLPVGREYNYYHGTYIAGVVTNLLEQTFGKEASDYVKIMPVKALSDNTQDPYIKDGYKGIKYAIDNGADIICCAWSGGTLTPEENVLLMQARAKGIIVLASAGNSFSEMTLSPASHESVIAIAAVDSIYKKAKESNYGMFVDLSAPGRNVLGADIKSDDGYILASATSAAVATATACFATLKVLFPQVKPNAILKAIENTAIPINDFKYDGKLGSGFININESYNYLKDPTYAMSHFNSTLPKGVIDFNNHNKKDSYTVVIKPHGAYKGIHFKQLEITDDAGKSSVKIYVNDTTLNSEFLLSQMPEKFFVPGSNARLDMSLKNASKIFSFEIAYEVETIDSSKLYCSGTRTYELPEGVISDGSGKNDYSGLNDCKWIIKAPTGKRIQIDFDEMNTQANIDYVYLFDGERAIPEYTIAQFSGNNIPPKVISRTNTVLVWFVTDDKISGNGWQLRYKVVD